MNAALREVGQRLTRLTALARLGEMADQGDFDEFLDNKAWADQLTSGVIARCPVVELEFLYSARSRADRAEKRRMLQAVFGWVPMSERAYGRADEVQRALTENGQHRSAGPVDLLIAATAERERLVVLCDDKDFEVVASVTGQPVRRVSDQPRPGREAETWPARRTGDEDGA